MALKVVGKVRDGKIIKPKKVGKFIERKIIEKVEVPVEKIVERIQLKEVPVEVEKIVEKTVETEKHVGLTKEEVQALLEESKEPEKEPEFEFDWANGEYRRRMADGKWSKWSKIGGTGTSGSSLTEDRVREIIGEEDMATGDWGYLSGVDGTEVLTGNKRVLRITATALEASGSIQINGGDSVPIPYGASDSVSTSLTIEPMGNLEDPTIIFTDTDSYFIEYVV